MFTQFLPEGRAFHSPANHTACASLPGLIRAMEDSAVLEGRAILCTPEHDLTVSLGPFTGILPREEAALGIREGTAREISILSRVGKPTAVLVESITGDPASPTILLSRRKAQEKALHALSSTPAGTILPAAVTHLEPFGAFVDVGCGIVSLLGLEAISVSRIAHPRERFQVGQPIHVVLTGADLSQQRVYISHKELLGTWAENAAAFAPGMTVSGIVRAIHPYGSFIELTPNLTGLADRTAGLQEGDHVSVYIKSLSPEKMKVKLSVIHKLTDPAPRPPLPYFLTSGRLSRWRYSPGTYTKAPVEHIFQD